VLREKSELKQSLSTTSQQSKIKTTSTIDNIYVCPELYLYLVVIVMLYRNTNTEKTKQNKTKQNKTNETSNNMMMMRGHTFPGITLFLFMLLACTIVPASTFSVSAPPPIIGASSAYLSNIGTKNTDNIINSDYSSHDTSSESSESIIPKITPARQSLPDHLRLEEIPGKGFGIITKVFIPKYTVVGDYKGEVMTAEEKDRRYLDSYSHLRQPIDEEWKQARIDTGQTITGSYLFGVAVPNKSDIYVDAEDEYYSLWTRFLNHAPLPFSNVNPKSLHEGIDGKPRVWFVSIRDIEIGEEICFDYGDDYWLPEDNVV
jgi:hypothetical protein